VPLVVYVPWIPASHGQTSAALVEAVDLYPTMLELFGLDSAAKVHDIGELEGHSFAPILRAPDTPVDAWKNATFTQVGTAAPESTIR